MCACLYIFGAQPAWLLVEDAVDAMLAHRQVLLLGLLPQQAAGKLAAAARP